MIDIEKNKELPVQGTTEWHRARLGQFNASRISELMVSGKKKDDVFGKTALSYINEVASERALDPDMVMDDEQIWIYLDLVGVDNRYMRWGSMHEHEARETYEKRHGVEVVQVGSIQHPTILYYACSPDGLVVATNSGIEIKCPLPKTYWEWKNSVTDAESLKKVKPEYYWQVMSQIDICDLDYVDFVAWCPLMAEPMHEVRIMRDEEAITLLRERVTMAEQLIEEQINK